MTSISIQIEECPKLALGFFPTLFSNAGEIPRLPLMHYGSMAQQEVVSRSWLHT